MLETMLYVVRWKEAWLSYDWGCQRNGNEVLTPEGSKHEGEADVSSRASKSFVSDSSMSQILLQGGSTKRIVEVTLLQKAN